MENLPAIAEPQEVQGKSLTVEQSVEFKLSAHKAKAKELQALIANGVPTIAGIGDKAQYAKVSEWRKMAMRARTSLDSDRKNITEDARKFQTLVNSEAKLIAADIEAVENSLFAEENRIDKLIEADKAEKQRIINERVAKRTQDLLAVRHDVTGIAHLLAGMPEDQFQTIFAGAKSKFDTEEAERRRQAAELARLQAEETERKRLEEEAKAEAQRVESERLEAQRKAQAEAQAKIDAQLADIARQQKAIEDAKAAQKAEEEAKERKAREDRIAAEAAERARVEAEAKAKREQAEREAKAEADRLEKIRMAEETRKQEEAKAKAEVARLAAIEAAKPDAEKWLQFAKVVRGLQLPTMATPKGEDVERLVKVNIENLAKLIESEAQKLTK